MFAFGVLTKPFEGSLALPLRVVQHVMSVVTGVERRRNEARSMTHPPLDLRNNGRNQRALLLRLHIEPYHLRERIVLCNLCHAYPFSTCTNKRRRSEKVLIIAQNWEIPRARVPGRLRQLTGALGP